MRQIRNDSLQQIQRLVAELRQLRLDTGLDLHQTKIQKNARVNL